jgi:hypothetical protein
MNYSENIPWIQEYATNSLHWEDTLGFVHLFLNITTFIQHNFIG